MFKPGDKVKILSFNCLTAPNKLKHQTVSRIFIVREIGYSDIHRRDLLWGDWEGCYCSFCRFHETIVDPYDLEEDIKDGKAMFTVQMSAPITIKGRFLL
jgi:hypothetical protein